MTLPSESHGTETGPTAPAGGLLAGVRGAGESARKTKLAAWVHQQYEESRRARAKFERQWYYNLQFYRGNQNVAFRRVPTSSAGYKLAVPPAPPWRVRPVINRIRPIVRREIAKLTAQRPTFVVVPATYDDQDQASARVAEQVLEARYSDLSIARTQRLAVWWASICGTSFIKDYWDPSKGPQVTSELGGGQQAGSMPAGDSCVEALDAFHLFVPDLRQPGLDGQPWVIHAATHSAEYVKTYFGVERPAKTVQATELFTDDLLQGAGAPKPTGQVLVLECWLQPGAHPDFEAGGMVTVVGGQVVIEHKGPVYQHAELPFTKLDVIETGTFYSASTIEDLIPLQQMYNRQRGQIIENANTMGKPKWLAPAGAVNASQIDSEPGQVISYQPVGPAPQMIQPPPLPEYVQALPETALRDMDDISGQHEISRGQSPGQVTAATAISYLQEQDETMLSYAVASLEDGMARIGKHLLSHAVQFWGAPRLVKVVGDDGSFDAVQFGGNMLRGEVDVRVQAGSALPTSRAARQATALELYKLGAFGAPGSPEAATKLLEVLDMAGMEAALEDWRIDQREAQRENTLLAAGQPAAVQPWQNHAAHIVVHNRYRKGQKFLTLPPEIQQLFAVHVQEHEQANMMQQMVAAGAGMGPTGPSGNEGPGGGPAGPSGGEEPGAPAGPGGPDPGTLAAMTAGQPEG